MSKLITDAPGTISPQVVPFPEGANSSRTAAIAQTNANIKQQSSLMGVVNGGSKRQKYGGSNAQIVVPTMQVLYPEPGAAGQTVNGNITSTTKLGATSNSNSVYDACIGQGPSCTASVTQAQIAGSKKRTNKKKSKKSNKKKSKRSKRRGKRTSKKRSKRGGIKWGCYSGGKSKKTKSK